MRHAERGVALINVLFLATVLSAILGTLSFRVRHQIGQVQLMQDRLQAELLAESVMAEVQFELLTDRRTQEADSIQKSEWQLEMEGKSAAPAPTLNFYGEPVLREAGKVKVTLVDGANQFNLFTLEQVREQMLRYLENHGVETEAAWRVIDGIADWIDEDHFHHLYGAEQEGYGAGSGMPRNDVPEHFAELKNVKGMTPQIWALLAERLGYFGGDLSRYLLLDRQMLHAIMPPEQVAYFDDARRENRQINLAEQMQQWQLAEQSDFPGYPSKTLLMTVEAEQGEATARLSCRLVKRFGPRAGTYVFDWKRGAVQ